MTQGQLKFGIFGTVVEAAVAYARYKEAASQKNGDQRDGGGNGGGGSGGGEGRPKGIQRRGGCRRFELDERLLGET